LQQLHISHTLEFYQWGPHDLEFFKDIFGNAVNNYGASIEGWKYEWEGLWNVFENLDGNNLGHFVEHCGHQSLVETSYTCGFLWRSWTWETSVHVRNQLQLIIGTTNGSIMNHYVKFHCDKIANFENSMQYLFALGPSLWTYVQSISHAGVKDLKWAIFGWPKDIHNKKYI
jgi:hypothetical protein